MNYLYNLARVSTATTGTGTMTLGGAIAGFLTFAQAGVPDGTIVTYAIADGANSEVGQGTYTLSGLTLSRNVVYRSTGAANVGKITLSGSAQVVLTPAAEDFRGTITNDSAPVGYVGEYAAVSSGSASISSSVVTNITSLSLTAGDWDAEGVVLFAAAGSTTVVQLVTCVSLVSEGILTAGALGRIDIFPNPTYAGSGNILPTGRRRISLSETTTIYLVAFASFSTSTMTTVGEITARRVR